MKKTLSFWKRHFGARELPKSGEPFGDVIGVEEAQQIRGGDKEYTPLYDLQPEPNRRQPSILLDFS
ncbi:hypothetical protein [Spirosoma spitsbergense]|uniref:hypothetical protein n=1 Tax=Spirosoma spitsbergense TaxID=431554 RepID=UPI00037A6725|nr:hypothetical protein [Spirosoma spitsbergense]